MDDIAVLFAFLLFMPLAIMFVPLVIGVTGIVVGARAQARQTEAEARLQEAENEARRLGAKPLREAGLSGCPSRDAWTREARKWTGMD